MITGGLVKDGLSSLNKNYNRCRRTANRNLRVHTEGTRQVPGDPIRPSKTRPSGPGTSDSPPPPPPPGSSGRDRCLADPPTGFVCTRDKADDGASQTSERRSESSGSRGPSTWCARSPSIEKASSTPAAQDETSRCLLASGVLLFLL